MKLQFRLRADDVPTQVVIGSNILARQLAREIGSSGTRTLIAVICDRRVHSLHRDWLVPLLSGKTPVLLLPGAESTKSESSLRKILHWLQQVRTDRHSLILAIGGGVITDLVGFAASIYMRGVDYISIPTTLVGQVDAAIGGKTAVNFGGIKNSIGTFHAPRAVIADQKFLQTLRENQIRDGLVEAFKIFCVRSRADWNRYTQNSGSPAGNTVFSQLITDAVRLKIDVVNRDPFERNLRRILNFGHTAGHAYESLSGHSHGHSVAFGIQVALELSARYTGLPNAQAEQAGAAFLALYHRFDRDASRPQALWERIQLDKKRRGSAIPFVLIKSIGRHVIRDVNYREFAAAVSVVRERFA
jgi:3-dehydroquinate synthase